MKPIVDRSYGGEGYRLFFDKPKADRLFEVPVQVCVHCESRVVLNPERRRPRGHCRRCDAYVCDECAGLPCRFEKRT